MRVWSHLKGRGVAVILICTFYAILVCSHFPGLRQEVTRSELIDKKESWTLSHKCIMIQGTGSAGKSLLVTALCRIFKQDGWRVAPLKHKIWHLIHTSPPKD